MRYVVWQAGKKEQLVEFCKFLKTKGVKVGRLWTSHGPDDLGQPAVNVYCRKTRVFALCKGKKFPGVYTSG